MKDLILDDVSKIRAIKIDMPQPYLKYIGTSQETTDSSLAKWKIYRETIEGTVFSRIFAEYSKYVCIWDNRTTYFPAPPAAPLNIPTDDIVSMDVPEGASTEASLLSLITAVAKDSSLAALAKDSSLAALAKDTSLSSIITLLTSLLAQNPMRAATFTMVAPAVNVLLVSVVIAPANANRKGFMIWNNGANSAYVTLGATSTSASPTWIVPTFSTKEFVSMHAYTGPISAIRNAGSGNIVVWEIT